MTKSVAIPHTRSESISDAHQYSCVIRDSTITTLYTQVPLIIWIRNYQMHTVHNWQESFPQSDRRYQDQLHRQAMLNCNWDYKVASSSGAFPHRHRLMSWALHIPSSRFRRHHANSLTLVGINHCKRGSKY